jgi:dephospho-CoA kinase
VTAPPRRFLLVGLTGGIATGKSTVSQILRSLGCVVVDADQLAREVTAPGEPALATVAREFGDVLAPDGSLDRKKLAAIVFADPAQRRRLEAILHPAIRQRFLARLAALEAEGFDGIVIWDAPVMIESGGHTQMDRLVVVITAIATQRARLLARDGDAADGERRIANQMPLADKAALAHYVIDNSGDRAATEARTREVHAALLADLRARYAARAR